MALGLLAGCSTGPAGSTDEPETSSPAVVDDEGATPGAGEPTPLEPPPLDPLAGDQPGGPTHESDVAVRPSPDELTTAAAEPPDRLAAERFGLFMVHAIENQTEVGDTEFESYLAPDLPEAARAAIDASRSFPGNQVASGERAWLRSDFVVGSETRADVYVVEKVLSPMMGDGSKPFVFWSATRVRVVHGSSGWRLVDFSQGLASETAEFSPYAWESQMNSGRGWRRVRLS